jgi:SH3-like domain-containing protein
MGMRWVVILFVALFSGLAHAAEVGEVTGMPLGRYASLKSAEVNVRTGPGTRYPILWVFQRAQMPVQIVGEYEHWRKIRDFEGTEGWVHKAMVSGTRSAIVIQDGFTMRSAPTEQSPPVARLSPTVVGTLETCENGWCLMQVKGFKGWVKEGYLWGDLKP